MKFFSTYSNFRAVLVPGLPGDRALGRQSKPMTSAKFVDGVVDIDKPMNGYSKEDLIEMMMNHPGYGKDFVAEDLESREDPYKYKRKDSEPQHSIAEIKHGSVVGSQNAGRIVSPDKQKAFDKAVKDAALKLVQKMLDEKDNKDEEVTDNTPKEEHVEPVNVSTKLMAPEPIEDDESVEEASTEAPAPIVKETKSKTKSKTASNKK